MVFSEGEINYKWLENPDKILKAKEPKSKSACIQKLERLASIRFEKLWNMILPEY